MVLIMENDCEKEFLKFTADIDKRVSVLEIQMEAQHERLEKIDTHIGGIFKRLNEVAHSLDRHMTEEAKDRAKQLAMIMLTLGAVVLGFVLDHLF